MLSSVVTAVIALFGADAATIGDADGTLRLPEAVAVAPDGAVLIGDHYAGRVLRFEDGRYVSSFGLRGNDEECGRLGAIGGLAVAPDGRVFVMDTDHQRVTVFAEDGAVLRCFGERGRAAGQLSTGSGSFAGSSASGGLAIGGKHLYVADTGNSRVVRYTLDGRDPKVLGKGTLKSPQGLAVRGGRLLVADTSHHRVVELTAAGKLKAASTFDVRYPYDVAIAGSGHAYVADNNGHRIVELDRALKPVRRWGSFGDGRGKLEFPRALALTGSGELLVADAANDRVVRYGPTGTLRGTIGIDGRVAGTLTAPRDVAVNAYGEVAVADGNPRISWFGLDGRSTGTWAAARSFQSSTAIVSGPEALAFSDPTHLRVEDGLQIRQFGAGQATGLLDVPDDPRAPAAILPTDFDIDAAGVNRVLDSHGWYFVLGADGRPGPKLGEEVKDVTRSNTAIAGLADGTTAIGQGPRTNTPKPADAAILRYDAAGRRISSWPMPRPPQGHASDVGGLVATADGGLWASDTGNDRLVRFDAAGRIAETVGGPGTAPGRFAGPRGLAIACDGSLLVADAGNNRLQRLPGAEPAVGCAAAPSPTAKAVLPRPAGLKVKTRRRATRPQAEIATISASCARACTIAATAAGSAYAVLGGPPIAMDVKVRGTTVTVTAGPSAVAKLRRAMKAKIPGAAIGVLIRGTTADGIVDTASVTVTLRP